ncbi:hypothetical protein B296_00032738 [Ensete ventricosum]|uniref:Uncharacterized protein n=1 Tax=Ensete ventricosum TaxID=4639 RepID=A0A426Z8B1_ENSVE|nr:hypothetical protein B296_00032738 [Ensete ventricosum]
MRKGSCTTIKGVEGSDEVEMGRVDRLADNHSTMRWWRTTVMGLMGSQEKHMDASSSDAVANGARLASVIVDVTKAKVVAREEHRRGWTMFRARVSGEDALASPITDRRSCNWRIRRKRRK